MTEPSEPVPHAGTSFTHRVVGAATLHAAAFEEIEHDRNATLQAAIVVFLASLSWSLGLRHFELSQLVADLITRFFQWVAWAAITWVVGTKIFQGTADLGELLRTLGFVHTPGLLYVLSAIPVLGYFVRVALALWIVVAAVIAIRQALDVTTAKALGIALAGLAVYVGLQVLRALVL